MAENKPTPIDPDTYPQLFENYPECPDLRFRISTGADATLAHVGEYPNWLAEVGQTTRDLTHHTFLGHIVTIPTVNYLAIENCYREIRTGRDKGDMTLISFANDTMEVVSPDEFDRRFPWYVPNHHTAKLQIFAQLAAATPNHAPETTDPNAV